MATSKKQAKYDPRSFLAGLKSLLDTLPTESQKLEIDNALTELINFLRELRSRFQAMPSQDDVSQVNQSLLKLEELFRSIENNPVVVPILATSSGTAKRKAGAKSTPKAEIDVTEILATLENTSLDEIRSQLASKPYKKPDVQAIASELGISTNDTQRNLADEIATHIHNRRMNRKLATAGVPTTNPD